MSPRDTSFISGLTSCDTETCVKPIARAQLGERALVLRVAIAVHQHDRDGADAGVERRAQRRLERRADRAAHDVAVRADALVDLDHPLVEQLGSSMLADEELRPVLVADAQRVARSRA